MALVTYVHKHNGRAVVHLGKGRRATFHGGTYVTADPNEQKLLDTHPLNGPNFKRLETSKDYLRLQGHTQRATVYAKGPMASVEREPEFVNPNVRADEIAATPTPEEEEETAPAPRRRGRPPKRIV